METLAFSIVGIWVDWLWPILLFVIGLGLVVFVHELGHFMMAKAAGIKVERFAFGFGPRLIGFVRGETDYCINLLPLGGYVKMLGQEDVKEAAKTADPRSFENKPIRARFAVIAAGVFMNFILAAVLFVIVALVGKDYLAPVVGAVRPGYPAAAAQIEWQNPPPALASMPASVATEPRASRTTGLMPGDRIVRIEDGSFMLNYISKPVTRFTDMSLVAALARPDSTFLFTIERQVDGRTCVGKARMGVKRASDDNQLAFGLVPALDTVLGENQDLITNTRFKDGDKLLAVNGTAIKHQWDIDGVEDDLTGEPVTVTVLRDGKKVDVRVDPVLRLRDDVVYLADGTRLRCTPVANEDGSMECLTSDGKTVTVAEDSIVGGGSRERLDILGMIPRMKVAAVIKHSPAQKAGVEPGDIVVGYGDRSAPTFQGFLAINREHAGTGTNITLLRGEKTASLWVVPAEHNDETLVGIADLPDVEHAAVAGIRPGSPAAAAGIEPGAMIVAVNGRPVAGWTDVYRVLADNLGQDIRVTYKLGAREQTAEIATLDGAAFDPNDYAFSLFAGGARFRLLSVTIVYKNPLKAIAWGARETCKLIITTYATLGRLSQGTVSTKSLSGPVGIGAIAVQAGRRGLIYFVYIMAFLSASLAVVNFLPIPVTDGGHAVFLLIEKIRGKPLPGRVINLLQVMGLLLLIAAFVALTWQDIARLLGNRW